MNESAPDRYAVIGFPIKHSWSPFIHGMFAKQTGHNLTYTRLEVQPENLARDVGEFFALDSVELKVDNKDVSNYLYTEREADALIKGGVQRLYVGNLKAGEHELVAVFSGEGTHTRDYRRGAALKFEKGIGPKYIELTISDKESKQQPEFVVKEWE